MAMPFLNGAAKRRDHLLSVDLGGRTTKAVHLHRKGERYVLSGYALRDAPVYEKNLSAEPLREHLQHLCQSFNTKPRALSLAVGVGDSLVRHADLPPMPIGDLRQILKNNPKNYLQQDLPGHIFDCFIIPPRADGHGNGPAKPAEKTNLGGSPQNRVLVAGARKQLVEEMQTAGRNSGLIADNIVPGLLGSVNAFELAMPQIFACDVVALVDIGFKNSSICILQQGELVLSRVIAIGGDRLTSGLAESLGISYAEAEGIKVGMPTEVQANLEALVLPLGRELRASIDFFEHQQDQTVSQVFISGGSARSEFIVQTLQTELMAECKSWNPLNFLELVLPPEQAAEIGQIAPQLAVAVGAATGAF